MIAATLPTRANADLIEEYYHRWLENPDSVDPTWRAFFQGFTLGLNGQIPVLAGSASAAPALIDSLKQSQVHSLIYHYRSIGHIQAYLDPLHEPPAPSARLALSEFGLVESDLETFFDVGHYLDGGQMRLADLIASLKQTYCGPLGVEYPHIPDPQIRRWLQNAMEPRRNQPNFDKEQKIRILRRLHKAEVFEHFLQTKYVGQKRFSLEGGETLIPALHTIVEQCAELRIDEIVLGMAHRGRLNVLANILQKSIQFIFEEFSENFVPDTVAGDGDVKYHLGYEAVLDTRSGRKVEVRLAANPSHLEAVDPVVQGKARARQRLRGDVERRRVLPLLLHGDAAFAAQGTVAEVLNFSQLPGYRTGGTVHFVINNQIGFTTLPVEARSSRYCTDIAKMIEAPIFHVNGDDPEAVCYVAGLALDFRQQFQRDVVIDMVCYRRHGHNESDEPAFTQPLLYRTIAAHPPPSAILSRKLIAEGTITAAESDAIKTEYTTVLEEALARARKKLDRQIDDVKRFEEAFDLRVELEVGRNAGQAAPAGLEQSGRHGRGGGREEIGVLENRRGTLEALHVVNLAIELLAGAGERLLQDRGVFGLDGVGFRGGDRAFGDQLPAENRRGGRMSGDGAIEQGLGERGLVRFVVPVAAVADHVDHDVALELLPEIEGEAGDIADGLRVVAVDVENRCFNHLGDVRAVTAGAGLDR